MRKLIRFCLMAAATVITLSSCEDEPVTLKGFEIREVYQQVRSDYRALMWSYENDCSFQQPIEYVQFEVVPIPANASLPDNLVWEVVGSEYSSEATLDKSNFRPTDSGKIYVLGDKRLNGTAKVRVSGGNVVSEKLFTVNDNPRRVVLSFWPRTSVIFPSSDNDLSEPKEKIFPEIKYSVSHIKFYTNEYYVDFTVDYVHIWGERGLSMENNNIGIPIKESAIDNSVARASTEDYYLNVGDVYDMLSQKWYFTMQIKMDGITYLYYPKESDFDSYLDNLSDFII